jgi:hypothetical protein
LPVAVFVVAFDQKGFLLLYKTIQPKNERINGFSVAACLRYFFIVFATILFHSRACLDLSIVMDYRAGLYTCVEGGTRFSKRTKNACGQIQPLFIYREKQ